MSLQKETLAALNQLTIGSSTSQTLAAEHAGQRLTCELTALDTLGCAFTTLTVASDVLAGASTERLKKLADALSRRINYLLEPVNPIEVDPEQCVVQLRSVPPQKDDSQTSYYELHVRRGGQIDLARYAKDRGQPRQVVPAQVTREVLLRLVGDFSAVLNAP
jgi:hypothetical protein